MEVFENAEGDDDGTDDAMHHVFECLFGSSCFRFSWRSDAITVLYDVSKVETTEAVGHVSLKILCERKESDAMRILSKIMTQKMQKWFRHDEIWRTSHVTATPTRLLKREGYLQCYYQCPFTFM